MVIPFNKRGAKGALAASAPSNHPACIVVDAIRGPVAQVRCGLHTGEVEVEDGDVHGIAIHIAARIMGDARPDEVLVSGAVPPLVLGSGLAFDDRGRHRLKSVPDRWPVLAVHHDTGAG
ncbi:nucleotidyl cyclase domain-containing protein [Mycobacterium montefiorense]|uniref:hypothetical protein n=1 Tax=Mycobacterium montefiorense TaxID=154654 RepID=UPI0021DC8464|nr:hypothetical protein [Mycobacterium montefiorense]GLE50720.1 hypothetical protein ATCCBAA256_03070 [Mycobacterium montefiorense]